MEDRLLVAKALVSCSAHIGEVCEAIEKSVEKCARSGFYAIYSIEQMRIYERLLKYNERKRILFNMKYVIEKGLGEMRSENVSLLKERFEKRKGMADMKNGAGLSLRTLYRRMDRALEEFASALERIGFDKKRILIEFGNEPLFAVSLNRVIKEDDEVSEIRERMKNVKEDLLKKHFTTRVLMFKKGRAAGGAERQVAYNEAVGGQSS